jgi:hypothetical protein
MKNTVRIRQRLSRADPGQCEVVCVCPNCEVRHCPPHIMFRYVELQRRRASTIPSRWLARTIISTASRGSIPMWRWLLGFLYEPIVPANRAERDSRWAIHVRQSTLLRIESLAHQLDTEVFRSQPARPSDCDLHLLECLKYSGVVIAAKKRGPDFQADRGIAASVACWPCDIPRLPICS